MSDISPILYVIDHFKSPNAGTEGQLYQLIKHIDREQFSPELLVFSSSPWLDNTEFPCPVHVLGHRSLSSLATWRALASFAKSYSSRGGRLAHVFFNDPSIICPPVFYFFGIKTLISRRDMGYWYTHINKLLLRFTRRFTSGAVANSKAVAEATCKGEGYRPRDVKVIYNGYECELENYSPIPELESIKASGVLIVTLVANIRPIKRINDVLYAMAQLKRQGIDVVFLQIGDGDKAELKVLAEGLGISKQVYYMGKRSDVKNCLQYADVGLLCSESEGFSNAIVEYLRQGLPVICSDVGGNGEAVEHGETGYLYPCGNIPALTQAIKGLAENSALRLQMGSTAKKEAIERYGVETMVSHYSTLYQEQ